MSSLNVKDIKIFVPTLNFDESLEFYKALGWQLNWLADDSGLAELELASCRFYLQNYYNKEWANNFMMHITVEDAEAWWQHASQVTEKEAEVNAVAKNQMKIAPIHASATHGNLTIIKALLENGADVTAAQAGG